MIDSDGYRLNVGIILANHEGKLFWARRVGKPGGVRAWQFPQGGIKQHETPEEALYRELAEEIGLAEADVTVLGCTDGWLRYRLPKRYIRTESKPVCIGQKQKWFLLRLVATEEKVSLVHGASPEFDKWRWVNYWYPLKEVVAFKREVYRRALEELAPLIAVNTT